MQGARTTGLPSEPDTAARALTETFDEGFRRRLQKLALAARRIVKGRERGERKTSHSGAGIEFANHRPYVAGDDIRALDWKAFGRSDRLLLKQFEAEQDLSVYVLLDSSGSMSCSPADPRAATAAAHPGKQLYAKQIAAALSYVALSNLDRVSVQTFAERPLARLPPQRGKNHALTVLRFIAEQEAQGRTDLARSLATFAAREERRGLVLVVTDGYDEAGLETGLRTLRHARFEAVLIELRDPGEDAHEVLGDVCLEDAETGARLEVTVTEAMLARMREAKDRYRARLAAFCREQQIRHFVLSTHRPFEENILELLGRGGLFD